MALIDHGDWSRLDRLLVGQQRNRSAPAPVISRYRWRARRPHCFAGALFDAANEEFRFHNFWSQIRSAAEAPSLLKQRDEAFPSTLGT